MTENLRLLILENESVYGNFYRESLERYYQLSFASSLGEYSKLMADKSRRLDQLLVADIKILEQLFELENRSKELSELLSMPTLIVCDFDNLDRVRNSLDRGAVDFIVKPFAPADLLLRLERLLRIPIEVNLKMYSMKSGSFDKNVYQGLTDTEQRILRHFLSWKDQEVSRKSLMDDIWPERAVTTKVLDVHLHNLKKKLALKNLEIVHTGKSKWKLLSASIT